MPAPLRGRPLHRHSQPGKGPTRHDPSGSQLYRPQASIDALARLETSTEWPSTDDLLPIDGTMDGMSSPTLSLWNTHTPPWCCFRGADQGDEDLPVQREALREPMAGFVGLMRGYAALGDTKKAMGYAKLAVGQAPDPANKKNLENMVKFLSEGKNIN
jgi:hypothetical protein